MGHNCGENFKTLLLQITPPLRSTVVRASARQFDYKPDSPPPYKSQPKVSKLVLNFPPINGHHNSSLGIFDVSGL